MSTFKPFQRKNLFTPIPATPTYPSLRPARSLTSPLTPAPEQVQPATFEYSFTTIPLYPAVQRKALLPSPLQEESKLKSRIQAATSSGHSLDKQAQQRLEQGLEADLSGIRVHTDNEADHLARSVNAIAFTTGPHIFFRSGAYNPGTSDGMHLLAHETIHTLQQATGPVAGKSSAGAVSISDPGDRFEQAAEASANRIIAGQPLQHSVGGKQGQYSAASGSLSALHIQRRRYKNNAYGRAQLLAALNRWFNRASANPPIMVGGAWLQLHDNGSILYNCGGIEGGQYGADYVDDNLYDWFVDNLPGGYAVAGGPTARGSGEEGVGGRRQFVQDYYTITRIARANYQHPGGSGIPAGNYQLILNYHLYVGKKEANPLYEALPPPQPEAPPAPFAYNAADFPALVKK